MTAGVFAEDDRLKEKEGVEWLLLRESHGGGAVERVVQGLEGTRDRPGLLDARKADYEAATVTDANRRGSGKTVQSLNGASVGIAFCGWSAGVD